jgi:hypothetical protein
MSYRITNIEKWKDLWFSNLSVHAKLLFFYFVENCDNAGFIEVNKKFMLFYLGFNEEELMNAGTELKKSYIKSKDGSKLWIKNFLKYQKKLPLNNMSNVHKQIISIIQDNLSDETKFKGCDALKSMLPTDLQTNKPTRKKREVVATSESQELNNDKPISEPTTSRKFIKPTQQEVYEYMVEKEFEFAKAESERFINFFDSKGWRIGKNTMKIWRSAVNNWMMNYYERNKILTPKKSKLEVLQKSHEISEDIDWNEFYKDNRNEQFN